MFGRPIWVRKMDSQNVLFEEVSHDNIQQCTSVLKHEIIYQIHILHYIYLIVRSHAIYVVCETIAARFGIYLNTSASFNKKLTREMFLTLHFQETLVMMTAKLRNVTLRAGLLLWLVIMSDFF